MTAPLLLPMPRQMTLSGESVKLPEKALIVASPALLFEAQQAQQSLKGWEIVAGGGYANTGLSMQIDAAVGHAQGYFLTVDSAGITLRGADAAGIFYGVCTLRQLIRQFGATLPALTIEDYPDFPARGVMLDVSRDKVPTMETLYALVERLASWKINQLQLYMEHTFAYRQHPQVWAQASPFTGQEIMELDVFCRQRHIELVPNQNSLGHMERWLKFDPYHALSECPDGFNFKGEDRPPATLDPADPGSIQLIASLYDELLPHFTSKLFNAGADEPFELGLGKSKEDVEKRGGRVYLDFLLKLRELVISRGRQMMFWGDIITEHPDLIPDLPKDLIALEWGYEADHKFHEYCARYAASGLPFYVCPGTSGWNSFVGRTDNAIGNLLLATDCGLAQGAIGYLITDWGDRGHWQPLPVSYLGFMYGAAVCWSREANHDIDIPRALDLYVFEDHAGVMGRLAYDLGNVYKMIGPESINGHMLFYLMQAPQPKLGDVQALFERKGKADISPENLRKVLKRLDEIMQPLDHSKMRRDDEALVRDEFLHAAEMLRHAIHRMLTLQNAGEKTLEQLITDLDIVMARHRAVWMARNRPGGLADSLARFEAVKDDYRRISVS